jgi:hypothetical protein
VNLRLRPRPRLWKNLIIFWKSVQRIGSAVA